MKVTSRSGSAPGKARMLDAAEELFATYGFDGVAVRDITRRAEVEVGLATYHFKTKVDLFRETLLRRAPAFAGALHQALDNVLATDSDPAVRAILSAYFDTHVALVQSPEAGWRSYIRLAAAAMLGTTREDLTGSVRAIYRPVMERYELALVKAVPYVASGEVSRIWSIFRRSLLSVLIAPPDDSVNSGGREPLRTTFLDVFSKALSFDGSSPVSVD